MASQGVCPGMLCGAWLCAEVEEQQWLWSGFCPPMGCWRRTNQGSVGHFQLCRGSRFASYCLLARASILWGEGPRQSFWVMVLPGFKAVLGMQILVPAPAELVLLPI